MEGFSMPGFTKRTVSPPSPHSIGPCSHCSTLPGPLSLGPTVSQLCMGPLDLPSAGFPDTQIYQAPSLKMAGSALTWAPAPQAKPLLHLSTRITLHRHNRTPLDLCSSSHHSAGPPGPCFSGPLGHCSIRPPSMQPWQIATFPGLCIAGPPDYHSAMPPPQNPSGPQLTHCHHRRAPNLPKTHRQRGLDAKGITSEQLRL
jgi:hypothetical protein